MWHDIGHSFLWVWVGVSASQKIPLFWCETHIKSLRARFPTRSDEEGRKALELNRRTQWTEQGSQLERAVNRSRGKLTVRER